MSGVTDPSEEYFKDGLWGWDGSQWRKLGLLWGFGGVVEEALSNTDLASGVNYLNGTPVPAGEVWVVQNVSMEYDGTAPTRVGITVVGLADHLTVLDVSDPAAYRWHPWNGVVVLQEGDYMQGFVSGATAGDDLYFRYAGYKMRLT